MGVLDREQLTLDLKKNEYKIIECKQYDNIILHFLITNFGEEVDLTSFNVQLNVKRPNRTYVIQSNGITKNSYGEITILCNKEITSVSGEALCEITLINEIKRQTSTFNVVLDIAPSAIEGINEDMEPLVVTVVERLQDAINVADDECIKIETAITKSINAKNDLESTISSAVTEKDNLNETIDSSITERMMLNNAINTANSKMTQIDEAIEDGVGILEQKAESLETEMEAEMDSKMNYFEDIKAEAGEIRDDVREIYNTISSEKDEMEDLIVEAEEYFPIKSEVYHALMNIMGMAIFTEREFGKRYTGAYTNMYIYSFVTTDNIELSELEYEAENHRVTFGDGYVESIAYTYE